MSNISGITKGEIEAWSVVYGIEGFLTVVGNAIAIVVFLATPSLHKRTYYLLVSLAVADFLVGALPVPMFIYVLGTFFSLWSGNNIQQAQRIIEICVSYASIYSLTAIAIERMLAVMFPWKHSLESRVSYIAAIIITWLLSIMTASFVIFYELKNPDVTKGFFLVIMVLLSFCLLITLLCYTLIAIKLCSNRGTTSSLPHREQRETQLAVTLLFVSIIFIMTWLPFQVVNFIVVFNPTLSGRMSYHYVLATKFLHYFNSLVNPFIYVFRIPDYQRGIKKLCCCSDETTRSDPNEAGKGPWQVRGISGPQSGKNPDNDYEVSMTQVSQAPNYYWRTENRM